MGAAVVGAIDSYNTMRPQIGDETRGRSSRSDPAREESEFDRPLGVTSLVGLLVVFVLGWVVGFLGIIANPDQPLPLGTTTALFVGVVVLVTAIAGVLAFGLWFVQRWAWYLGLVVAGLVGVGAVVAGEFAGLLAFVVVVYLLVVRGAFDHPRQMFGG